MRSGKLCNDLLTKDYKVGKTTVEVKSKTPAGVTFTPTATKKGDAVSGTLKAVTPVPGLPWLDSEAVFGTNGSVSLQCEAANALNMKGLTITAECDRAAAGKPGLLGSANLIAEYKSEAFACKTSYDAIKMVRTLGAEPIEGPGRTLSPPCSAR